MCSVKTRPKPRFPMTLARSSAVKGCFFGRSSMVEPVVMATLRRSTCLPWNSASERASARARMLGLAMRAIVVRRTGGPEVMELETLELGAPGPGEALVRHRAIGVNFIDTYQRSGLYSLPLPVVLGVEAAGVVEAVGHGVELAV